MIHSGLNEQSPSDILDVLEGAGADLSRTVLSQRTLSLLLPSEDATLSMTPWEWRPPTSKYRTMLL